MAQYDGLAIIPVEWVCRDYFRRLSVRRFLQQVAAGKIALPVVKTGVGHKAARGIHLDDLAAYLDAQTEKARKECQRRRRNVPTVDEDAKKAGR